MTHDEKKAALLAAGYELRHTVAGDNSPYEYWCITTPDGWEYETDWLNHPGSWIKFQPSPELEQQAIDTAYAHWQREQELVALRRFVWDMWSTAKRMRGTEPSLTIFTQADNLIKQFNITDDLTHEDVGFHNRLESLYDDDESSETDE